VLPEGHVVSVLDGPVSDGADDWYHVSTAGAGITGWVLGSYLASTDAAPPAARGGRSFVARLTAYANGADGGAVGNVTFSGTLTRWGVVAVDPHVIPLGSRLLIEGLEGEFVAEDTGSGVHGHAVDIWFPDVWSARAWGVQYRTVTVLD
jgi:3D (Asp-Asp-Asp) domain-containing protein